MFAPFGLTPLIGFGAEVLPEYDLITSVADSAGASVYTYNDIPVTPGGLWVVFTSAGRNGAIALTSITMNGVTASVIQSNGTNATVAIGYLPSDGTAEIDLVITWNATSDRNFYSLLRLRNLENTAPVDTDNPAGGSDTSRSLSIDIPANGILIAGSTGTDSPTGWTNATEVVEDTTETQYQSSAVNNSSVAQSALSVSSSQARAIIGASWR